MKITKIASLCGLLLIYPATIFAQDKPLQQPERWLYQPEYSQVSPSQEEWWKQYGDSTLEMLIAKAEANNYDAAAALTRIEIARRQVGAARAALYPSIDVSAGWSGNRSAGATSSPAVASHTGSSFNLGASVNWEIDVFGRVHSKTKAAKAGVRISRAEYDGVKVSLCANVASAYYQLRTYQQQYLVAKRHIESQQKVVEMTKVRQEAGLSNALEVSQANTMLYSTQSSLPGLESAIKSTANSIAVLLGVLPAEIVPQLLSASVLPAAPALRCPEIDMELLRRRPDVVESEMQLAQYAAQIGVAKKDFLPVLSLSGSIGTASHKANGLFGENSMEYSIAPTLSWTVFDGFARNSSVAQAKLQLEAATDNYNMTLLNAVEEVENAINQYNAAVNKAGLLKKVVDESGKSYELSVGLYKEGLTDFINVISSQQTFLENADALAEANGNVYAAQIAIYKALGGGVK